MRPSATRAGGGDGARDGDDTVVVADPRRSETTAGAAPIAAPSRDSCGGHLATARCTEAMPAGVRGGDGMRGEVGGELVGDGEAVRRALCPPPVAPLCAAVARLSSSKASAIRRPICMVSPPPPLPLPPPHPQPLPFPQPHTPLPDAVVEGGGNEAAGTVVPLDPLRILNARAATMPTVDSVPIPASRDCR